MTDNRRGAAVGGAAHTDAAGAGALGVHQHLDQVRGVGRQRHREVCHQSVRGVGDVVRGDEARVGGRCRHGDGEVRHAARAIGHNDDSGTRRNRGISVGRSATTACLYQIPVAINAQI